MRNTRTQRNPIRPAPWLALAALALGGCENLLGISDPVLLEGVETDGGADSGGGGGSETDAGATSADAGVSRDLSFEPHPVPCTDSPILDLAVSRSDSGAIQDGAIIALQSGAVVICRDPLEGGSGESIPLDLAAADAMWVGDVSGNGTDDIIVLGTEGNLQLILLQADGVHNSEFSASDYAVGPDPGFIAGAELSTGPALVLVETAITLMRPGETGYTEELHAELSAPFADAVFAGFQSPQEADLIALEDSADGSAIIVRLAGRSSPHYQDEQRYPLDALATGSLAALTGPEGLLQLVAAPVEGGLLVLPVGPDGTGLDAPQSVSIEIGGPLATGDLDGDGVDDLAGVRPSDGLGALMLSSQSEPGAAEFDLAAEVGTLAIGDVDRDGLVDVISAGAEGLLVHRQIAF